MVTVTKAVRHPLLELPSTLRTDWARLARTIEANYSLFPEWTEITAESHGIAGNVSLLTAYQQHNLVAVYPLTEQIKHFAGIKLRSLELVSNWISYHNRLISSLAPDTALEVILEEAARRSADIIHLANVQDDCSIGSYFKMSERQDAYRIHSISGEASPYLPLKRTWDEQIAAQSKKVRYNVRKREKDFSASTKLEMQWFQGPDSCSDLLAAIRRIEENSWKKQAGLSIFERETERRYHELLLEFLSSQNSMFGNVLVHGSEPIAYNLCCVADGWVGQLKTSFDTRFAGLGPGAIVIDHAIRHAIELGAREFDFLGGADPHKLAWTKLLREHTDYYLYLTSSTKGRIIGKLKDLRQLFFNAKPDPADHL